MTKEQSGQELPPSDRMPQRIAEGMIVTDRADEAVGTVQVVYFGGASEEAIQKALHSEPGETNFSPFAADNLPDELAARLMSQGYMIVDGPVLTGAKRYIRPEQIEGVFPLEIEGVVTDVVQLRVTRAELLNS
jgi:hypothetical protein